MAADLPEFAAHDVRRVDKLVAAAEALVAHPVFHDLADDGALGVPEDEACAGELLNAEEVELLAQDAMVAARGFFKAGEVGVQIFLGEEGGAVDALELRILLVAEPVSAGEAGDFEGFDAAGGGDVRAATEVDEVAVAIEADLVAGCVNLVTKWVFMKSPSRSNSARACSRGSYSRIKGSLRATTSAILASMAERSSGVKGFSR